MKKKFIRFDKKLYSAIMDKLTEDSHYFDDLVQDKKIKKCNHPKDLSKEPWT